MFGIDAELANLESRTWAFLVGSSSGSPQNGVAFLLLLMPPKGQHSCRKQKTDTTAPEISKLTYQGLCTRASPVGSSRTWTSSWLRTSPSSGFLPVNVAAASLGATLAMPTSPSLEVRFWSRRMLEGFRSLWMTHERDLCMKRSAVAICREGRLRLYSGRGERRSEGPQD
jgi:hypothetical protein